MIKRPTTKAGRALFLEALSTGGEVWEPDPHTWSANIRAIEAEAAAVERARMRALVEAALFVVSQQDGSGGLLDIAIDELHAALDDSPSG